MLPQVNIIRAVSGDFISFYENAGISGVLTAHGVWDELTITIAKVLIDISGKKPIVLDIGANMGTFSVPIGKHVSKKNGEVHCFEPQRIIYYQICGNIFLNQLDNVFAHNVALSTVNGINQIDVLDYHQAWNIGAYSLIPGKNEQQSSSIKQLCNFFRLDDFEIGNSVTLIKLDVEGMEYDVLSGGMNKIEKSGFPPILFESLLNDYRSESVLQLLKNKGYQLTQYANEDWLAQHIEWPSEIKIIKNGNTISYQRVR